MTDTAHLPAQLTEAEARKITDQLKSGLEKLWPLIERAYFGQVWIALGYQSWDAYLDGEFGTYRLRLPREERDDVIGSLHGSGMSFRAIAAVTGDSKSTIARVAAGAVPDGTTDTLGQDGKTYPRLQRARPKPESTERIRRDLSAPPEKMPKPESTERILRTYPAPGEVDGTAPGENPAVRHASALLADLDAARQSYAALTEAVDAGYELPAERQQALRTQLAAAVIWLSEAAARRPMKAV